MLIISSIGMNFLTADMLKKTAFLFVPIAMKRLRPFIQAAKDIGLMGFIQKISLRSLGPLP